MLRKSIFSDSVLLPFVLLDLLIFPRLLPVFGIPLSMLVVIRVIITSRMGCKNEIYSWICIFGFGCLSAINGYFEKQYYWVDDLKRVFQLSTSMLYGFVLFNPIDLSLKRINIILRWYFIWLLLGAVVFEVSEDTYTTFVKAVYPEAELSLDDNLGAGRFSFNFSDPNSLGYLVSFAVFALYFIEKNWRWLVLCIAISNFVILLTQSRGAYISLGVGFLGFLFFNNYSAKTRTIVFCVLATLAVAVFLLAGDFYSNIVLAFERRLQLEDSLGEGVGSGRIGKYEYFFETLNPFPVGNGYYQIKESVEFRPHSDLIRVNFSYGLPFLAPLMYFLMPRRKGVVIYFLIMLFPFLVNTLIDDYRLLPFYLISLRILESVNKKTINT